MRDTILTILAALVVIAMFCGLCFQVAADTITIERPGDPTVTIQVPPETDYNLFIRRRTLGSTTQGYSTNEPVAAFSNRVIRETLTEGIGARQR